MQSEPNVCTALVKLPSELGWHPDSDLPYISKCTDEIHPKQVLGHVPYREGQYIMWCILYSVHICGWLFQVPLLAKSSCTPIIEAPVSPNKQDMHIYIWYVAVQFLFKQI